MLPIDGVDILLGNDLIESCCHKKCSPSLQVNSTLVQLTQSHAEQADLYPACVTTRSMSKARVIDDIDLVATWLSTKLSNEAEMPEECTSLSDKCLPTVLSKASEMGSKVPNTSIKPLIQAQLNKPPAKQVLNEKKKSVPRYTGIHRI